MNHPYDVVAQKVQHRFQPKTRPSMEMPELHLDFWTIIFLVAGTQACFLAIMILLFNKDKNRRNLYLSAFLLFFGYMLMYNFCYWTNYMYRLPFVFYTLAPINYIFGPLLLLYLDTFREKPQLQKWWWLQFIPFVVIVLHISPFYVLPGKMKLAMMGGESAFIELLFHKSLGHMATFPFFGTYMIFYLVWKLIVYREIRKDRQGNDELSAIRKRWIGLLILLYTSFILSYLFYYLIANQPFFTIAYDYTITAIMTVSIYSMAYMGYKRPSIFSGELHKKLFIPNKYASSTLSPTMIEAIEKKLLSHMELQKPYLNNELKLQTLAQQVEFSPHQLSQVINERLGKSFNQFINEFRIRDAQALLANPANSSEPIIQIAYEVGFNNKTTFNASFKKKVGLTPSQYRSKAQHSLMREK